MPRFYAYSLFSAPLLAFLVYLGTLAPTITWRHWGIDTGEFAVAVYRLAVPHPTGFPVYLILGKVFTFLPWGDVAHRLNLMSAFFAALTVGLVSWTIFLGLDRTETTPWARVLGAFTGGAMLAFSPTFWSQAVITEVYTLNAFFFALLVLLLLVWRRNIMSDRALPLLVLIAFTFGLSLGNHVTMIWAAPGILFFILASRVRASASCASDVKAAVYATLSLFLGLSPYLLIFFRARQGAWPSLWDPSTVPYILEHVTGGPFKGVLFSLPLSSTLSRLLASTGFIIEQYGWVGFALTMAGVWFMGLRDRLLLWFLVLTGGATFLFALSYPVFDSQVYLIPVYLQLGVALGWGVSLVTGYLLPRTLSPFPITKTVIVAGASLSILSLPFLSLGTTYRKVDVSGDMGAYSYAKDTLSAVPVGTMLLSWGGPQTFGFWYLQYVEGHRPDVMVVDAAVWGWPSYQRNLRGHYEDLVPEVGTPDYIETLVSKNLRERPIYATPEVVGHFSGLTMEREGLLFMVTTGKEQG